MRAMTGAERQAQLRPSTSVADAQLLRFAQESLAKHPHLTGLLEANGSAATRDLADAVHLLCNLHGRHPGLIDLAYANAHLGPSGDWLTEASAQFERERLYLVRLTAAVGPLPSTPGAGETENAIQAQRHAVETLARSERRGCALGAATALVADWTAIRPMLDRAAARVGFECPPLSLPGKDSIARVIEASLDGPAAERALSFGAEQLLLQHRALFDLLEARASARGD